MNKNKNENLLTFSWSIFRDDCHLHNDLQKQPKTTKLADIVLHLQIQQPILFNTL